MAAEADISIANGDDPVTDFLVKLDTLIINDETNEALELLLDSDTEQLIEFGSMDFIHWIAGYVLRTPCLCDRNQDRWQCMTSMLEYVVKFGKPKEALLGLLNQLETYSSSIVTDVFAFELWMKQTKGVLLRLPVHSEYMRWGFGLIADCFSELPTPDTHLLDEDEIVVLEDDPKRGVMLAVTDVAVDFVHPFVEEVTKCRRKYDATARETQRQILASFILSVMDAPFAEVDFRLPPDPLDKDIDGRFELHSCVEKLMSALYMCYPYGIYSLDHIFSSLTLETKFSAKKEDSINEVRFHAGLVTLEYLNCCVGLMPDSIVCVYTPHFWFDTVLRHVAQSFPGPDDGPPGGATAGILKRVVKDDYAEKILMLCERFIASSLGQAWDKAVLSESDHQGLFLWLLWSASNCHLESRRKRAVNVFQKLLLKFDDAGQITLSKFIFAHFGDKPDNGAKGFLIDFYKKRLHQTKTHGKNDGSPSDYWRELPAMFNMFIPLPFDVEADLMQDFPQYMAALNLTLYVVGVRTSAAPSEAQILSKICPSLDGDLFTNMQKALDFSKAHYKLELDKVKEGGGDIFVNKLENLNSASYLQGALNSLDLLEYVLCRCKEVHRN